MLKYRRIIMIPYIGNFSLWLSIIFASLQFLFSHKKNYSSFHINKIASLGLILSSILSFACLIYSYIISDFTVLNVFQNSHTSKPLIYKIAAAWGNHEGSMLLWILVLCIFNYFLFKLLNKKNFTLIFNALEVQALIIIIFLFFTIFTSNPFERIFHSQENGMGFNPLLQDPALAIHPPLLYIGYVGFSAAFSISIATLKLNNNEKIPWHIYIKPFVIISWTFLTIGIALGSIWAYYELGWGGWWFWDPVENASLMPWLLGTALLHSLIIVEKKKSLQTWVLLLSILVFLLSLIGTFLVRSGILTSVHTFALDPDRGIYILVFTSLITIYSLILFGRESKKYINKNYFSFFSKQGSILINNIIMIIVCSTVFLGTLYPLIIESLTNNKISVGEQYYNSTVIPIVLPAIIIMGIGPILSWEKNNKIKIIKELSPVVIFTLLITIFIFFIYKSFSILGGLGIIAAFWIIINSLYILIKKLKKYSIGMIVAHLGFGFLILGITGSTIWQQEKIIRMKINDETKINKYNIIFKKVDEIKGSNYVAIRGNFSVFNEGNKKITILKPENRFYLITEKFTTEASIHTNLFRDLYIVLGEGNIEEGWIIRLYYNPLVMWIWLGAFAIFLGGIVSSNKIIKKIKILHS